MSAAAFAALRQFVRSAPRDEHCGLCHTAVAEMHPHLVDLDTRSLLCACEPCSLLFSAQGDARYKRVPRRLRRLSEMAMTTEMWDGLAIPIQMAFLFYNSRAGKPVAVYPSPAGATESLLALPAWDEIAAASPALQKMEADVEALLVNRLAVAAPEYYIAPIDECYKLVGIVRTHWRGLAGGAAVWRELDQYFTALRQRTAARTQVAHA